VKKIILEHPYFKPEIKRLKSGDKVFITGFLYMARDAAHKRMVEDFKKGKVFPFNIENQGIYYCGPAPARQGMAIGPAGPTTSTRMDAYTPFLLDRGLSLMIGKGRRSMEVIDSMVKNGCVYLGATGGAAALLSQKIKRQEIIAYKDLGAEAVRKIYVEDFPAIVIIDSNGNDLYETGKEMYGGKGR
jgi:fumarate hydratase subunit beta